VRLLDELNALAEHEPMLRVLIDETDLGAGFVGPSDIGRIARRLAEGRGFPLIRIGAFASNPVIYGLIQMFLAGADRVTAFNDHARARAWLLEG
jgi:hypothetical protein